MEIGCVDCMHGCVWHRKKPAIPDDGGGASRQYIRNDVVLYSDTIERRPRQYADVEGSCDDDRGLRVCELQRTWSLPHKYNDSTKLLVVRFVANIKRIIQCFECNVK